LAVESLDRMGTIVAAAEKLRSIERILARLVRDGHAELGRQVRTGTLSANAAAIATGQHPLPKLRLHQISIVAVALGIRDKAGAATSRALALIVGPLVDNASPFAIRAGLHGQASVFFAAGCPMSPRRCKAILG
jgi:hypothetical protein